MSGTQNKFSKGFLTLKDLPKTTSSGVDPIEVELLEILANNDVSIDFDSLLDNTYSNYRIEMNDVVVSLDGYLLGNFGVDGVYDATGYSGRVIVMTSVYSNTAIATSPCNLTSTSDSYYLRTTGSLSGELKLYNPQTTHKNKFFRLDGVFGDNGFAVAAIVSGGSYTNVTPQNSYSLFLSTGVFVSGKFKLIGIK